MPLQRGQMINPMPPTRLINDVLRIVVYPKIFLLCVLNFALYTIAFKSLVQEIYNKYIYLFVLYSICILILLGLGWLIVVTFNYDNYNIKILFLTSMLITQSTILIYGLKKTKHSNSKIWLLVAYFVPFIGSILYVYNQNNK